MVNKTLQKVLYFMGVPMENGVNKVFCMVVKSGIESDRKTSGITLENTLLCLRAYREKANKSVRMKTKEETTT